MNKELISKMVIVLAIIFSVLVIAGIYLAISVSNFSYLIIGIVGLLLTVALKIFSKYSKIR